MIKKQKQIIEEQKKQPKIQNGEKHAAILIVDKFLNNGRVYNTHNLLIYETKIHRLIDYYKHNNEAYQIFVSATKEEVRHCVNNPAVHSLHIFGHGKMGGLRFGRWPNYDFLEYSEFKNAGEKKVVDQFHCNGDGKYFFRLRNWLNLINIEQLKKISLKYLLSTNKSDENGFAKLGPQSPCKINKWIEEKYKTT